MVRVVWERETATRILNVQVILFVELKVVVRERIAARLFYIRLPNAAELQVIDTNVSILFILLLYCIISHKLKDLHKLIRQ